ncbi:cytochrome b5 [Orussus abietinus]|uniref:cytochrome b5 n=1 Tax=Orussus abietinus TaxID=222816 RepID=UPI00062656F1|nr:cytochrome b5 [Orussus abietinus]XP_012272644.1 cytochrome b5 [Orussus abietinus]XP_012272645.1 cytochrome b5 [Orussus abietinus]
MSSAKQYTREEVNKSNGTGKTLVIIHDKVYDVTVFLNEHPGGEEVLLDHGGKDASEDFDDVGHSEDAQVLMKQYMIGELVEAEKTNKTPKKGWVAGSSSKNPEKDKYVSGPGLPFYLLVVGLLAVLFAIYYLR